MVARYYDANIGRLFSNDPVGFKASNTLLFNRYAYANNNPYKYVDPYTLVFLSDLFNDTKKTEFALSDYQELDKSSAGEFSKY